MFLDKVEKRYFKDSDRTKTDSTQFDKKRFELGQYWLLEEKGH